MGKMKASIKEEYKTPERINSISKTEAYYNVSQYGERRKEPRIKVKLFTQASMDRYIADLEKKGLY